MPSAVSLPCDESTRRKHAPNQMNSAVKTERPLSFSIIRTLTACALLLFSVANAVSQTRGRKLQNPTSGDPVSGILWLANCSR